MFDRHRLALSLLFTSLFLTGCGGGGGGDSASPANLPPQADAGADLSVTALQGVTLTGSGQDSDGTIVAYAWSQISGPSVGLSGADQPSASFTAPAVTGSERLEFQLRVSDEDGAVASDRVTVTVNPLTTAILPDVGPDPSQCPATLADRGGATLHVCDCQSGADAACLPGDDADPGSAAAPRRSLGAALAAFRSGGQVAFCRGGAWSDTAGLTLDAGSCSSAAPCRLQDYGDPARARPLIRQTQAGGVNGLELAPGDTLTRWEGVRIHNLHLQKQGADGQGFGVFVFRNVNDVVMRCLEVEGFGIGVHLNRSGLDTGDVSLFDSQLHDNGVIGWLGGTRRTHIERNRFHNNGWLNASAFQHNLYLSDSRNDSVIRRNWLSGSALDSNGQCVGTSLVAHNDNSVNLLIEYNFIEESNPAPGCWGLTVDAAGSTTESHLNTVIRGNLVRNLGNLSIGVASCVDCLIENNIVVQTVIGGAIGIASPNRPTSPPDADVTGTVLRNNTVYFGAGASGQAYTVGERGSGYEVTNNIGYFANPQPGDSCYHFDLPAAAYDLVSSNLCYGAPFDSGTTGLDGMASISDPLFVNAPDDLRLTAGSPGQDSGTSVSASAIDILGRSRGIPPDRGAYELP